MTFKGWPDAALEFYVGLEADNSKAYWLAHQATYDECVKAPFVELSEMVEKEFGPLHLFRPYRDTRFSKDKTPYKTSAAAVTESEGGASYYVQISAEGLYAAAATTTCRPISWSGSATRSPTTEPGRSSRPRSTRCASRSTSVDAREVAEAGAARLRSRPSPRRPAAA